MSRDEYDTLLELLGFDLNRVKFRILKAIMKSTPDSDGYVLFNDINDQLGMEEGGKLTSQSLIYRNISSLKEEGLLTIEKSGYRHRYKSNLQMIANVIKNRINSEIRDRTDLMKQLETEVSTLRMQNEGVITDALIQFLSGTQPELASRFADGINAIRALFDQEIYGKAKSGDIVRIITEWNEYNTRDFESRLSGLDYLAKKGVKVRLLIPKSSLQMPDYLSVMRKRCRELNKVGNDIRLRRRTDETATYQFTARNTDSMVIVLSEMPRNAIYFSSMTNATLIRNAVESFDDIFESNAECLEGKI